MGVYVIADMACSHEGDTGLAMKIIDGAGQAEADAIQFQMWSLDDMMVPHHHDFEKNKNLEISREEWASLAQYTRDLYPEMHIIACVYEASSVDFAERIGVDAYKLHASDLSNPHLVKLVSELGRRIDLSVGASTLDEISSAIQWIRNVPEAEIWLMYGYQNFPTPSHEAHMKYMMKLKDLFELPVGYQDHSDSDSEAAFWLPAAALGLGVDVLEKHITHDRSLHGVDHEAALDPSEFLKFVEMVRIVEGAMGISAPKPFSDQELQYRKYARKSIVAARDLPSGTNLSRDDLLFMRSGELGLPPDQDYRLIGQSTTRNIAAYQLISDKDVTSRQPS